MRRTVQALYTRIPDYNRSGSSTSKWVSATNAEIIAAVRDKQLTFHGLEETLKPDYERAAAIRREIAESYMKPLSDAEIKDFYLMKKK